MPRTGGRGSKAAVPATAATQPSGATTVTVTAIPTVAVDGARSAAAPAVAVATVAPAAPAAPSSAPASAPTLAPAAPAPAVIPRPLVPNEWTHVNVTVPTGWKPGDKVGLTVDGVRYQLDVPTGLGVGSTFRVASGQATPVAAVAVAAAAGASVAAATAAAAAVVAPIKQKKRKGAKGFGDGDASAAAAEGAAGGADKRTKRGNQQDAGAAGAAAGGPVPEAQAADHKLIQECLQHFFHSRTIHLPPVKPGVPPPVHGRGRTPEHLRRMKDAIMTVFAAHPLIDEKVLQRCVQSIPLSVKYLPLRCVAVACGVGVCRYSPTICPSIVMSVPLPRSLCAQASGRAFRHKMRSPWRWLMLHGPVWGPRCRAPRD
jgi:hypothetical protein